MTQPTHHSAFARLLTSRGPFARVRPGEGETTALFALNLFLLLTSYYILKTVREPLILMGGGAEVKSYSAAGQALLLLAVVPLYSRLVNRSDRVRLIRNVTLFFMSNLAVFYFLALAKTPFLGVAFFLWVGIFSLMIIAQSWSLANDVFTEEQGKRLFPLVAFGSSLGAIFGSKVAGWLSDWGIDQYEMLMVAAVLLGVTLGITAWISRREREALERSDLAPASSASAAEEDVGDKRSGFTLVLQNRYLLLIALLLTITNIVNTNGEFILSSYVESLAAQAGGEEAAGGVILGFYSDFYTWVNALGAFLQLFVVAAVLRHAGVRWALFVLPVIALGGYAVISVGTSLLVVKIAKILENSVDYSLQNTTRQALFLPTDRAAKYKAKQAIDTFFVRAGDVLSAGAVFLFVRQLGFATRHFALINVAFVAVWLAIAAAIGMRYRRLVAERD